MKAAVFGLDIRREGGCELRLVEARKPSTGGRIGGTGAPGGGLAISEDTNSP